MKSRISFLKIALAACLIMAAISVLAACGGGQASGDPGYPGSAFSSSGEAFTLTVPQGWQAREIVPGANVLLANSAEALGRYQDGGVVEAGDRVVNIGFLPRALLQEKELAHIDFQFEASPEIFLESLLPLFRLGDGPAIEMGENASLVSINEVRDAGMLVFSQQAREGLVLVFAAADDVFAFISAVGYPGELAELREISTAIAGSVSFDAKQNALYSALNGD